MKIFVAGDYCPRYRLDKIIETGDYSSIFGDVKPMIANSDYSIVNLECPIATDEAQAIFKSGPNLKGNKNTAKAIGWAGFSCVTLANNHFRDYGDEGIEQTLTAVDAAGLDRVGGGNNIDEASEILYKDIRGQRIAIINCCEHEFSIATKVKAGSNPLNPVQQFYSIREAKANADYVLVIVHGGHEHFQLPSPRMVETYRFFVDAGADAVVNHHQHCFSGYERYQGKPIFYGLGNFCFDNKDRHSGTWTEGYAVTLNFDGAEVDFVLHPYRQCADTPQVEMLTSTAYNERIVQLNAIIAKSAFLETEVSKYYASTANQMGSIFEPSFNKYFRKMRYRGLLPSLIGKQRKVVATNYVDCESHRDRLLYWLKK